MKRIRTQAEEEAIREGYAAGASIKAMQIKLKVSHTVLRRWYTELGLDVPFTPPHDGEYLKILLLMCIKEGKTLQDVATMKGVTRQRVSQWAKKVGINWRSERGRRGFVAVSKRAKVTAHQIEETSKMTYEEAAKLLDVNVSVIYHWRRKLGLVRGRR